MNRDAEADDVERYQTVYAANNGSVAAPTAGLHFTPKVLDQLASRGHQRLELTLHVGAGTFKPLGDGDISAHQMHAEEIILSRDWLKNYLEHEGNKFAVGTTSLRTLESCHWIGVKLMKSGILENLGQFDAYELDQEVSTKAAYKTLLDHLQDNGIESMALQTQLMIRPGYTMKSVQGIITNFHQPGSTLLLLVSAGIGERWKDVYDHALANDYRFLSYGDSSLLYFNR
jgi:S-adenosylmethionine:tRNA ribosyltransferase-isomerase